MDFFNGLGKKFSSAARTVQERTREGVENTRLAADLRSARNELERQYADLGRAYYEFATDGAPEVPGELLRGIQATQEHIESMLAQKERMRQQTRCPGCGALQAPDARFCSNCGRRMPEDTPCPEPASGPSEDSEYCAECGAMRQSDSEYCAVCGHAFSASQAEQLPAASEAAEEMPCSEPLEEPEEADAYDCE